MAPPLSPQSTEAQRRFAERLFYNFMVQISRSKALQEGFGKFGRKAQNLTRKQMRIIARYASEYFVGRANPLNQLSERRYKTLHTNALDHALERFSNEHDT